MLHATNNSRAPAPSRRPRAGKFLALLFSKSCSRLTVLHLSNLPGLHWGAAAGMAAWPVRGLTKLHMRGVNLSSEFGQVFEKLPLLQELEIDGPACNIKAAALSW